MRYRIRRVAVWPLVKQGAVAGALVSLLPGLLAGGAALFAIRAIRTSMEAWETVRLPLPAPLSATANFISLLRLDTLLQTLRSWDAVPLLILAAIAACFLIAGIIIGALAGLVSGLLFNAGAGAGGLVVDVEPLDYPDPLPASPSRSPLARGPSPPTST